LVRINIVLQRTFFILRIFLLSLSTAGIAFASGGSNVPDSNSSQHSACCPISPTLTASTATDYDTNPYSFISNRRARPRRNRLSDQNSETPQDRGYPIHQLLGVLLNAAGGYKNPGFSFSGGTEIENSRFYARFTLGDDKQAKIENGNGNSIRALGCAYFGFRSIKFGRGFTAEKLRTSLWDKSAIHPRLGVVWTKKKIRNQGLRELHPDWHRSSQRRWGNRNFGTVST
jgi:hypothetical protein